MVRLRVEDREPARLRRAEPEPPAHGLSPAAVRALQRSAGNQATIAMLRAAPRRSLQRRWLFSEPGSKPAIFFWEEEPGREMPEEETERPEFQGRQWCVHGIEGVPEPPSPPYNVRDKNGRLTFVTGGAPPQQRASASGRPQRERRKSVRHGKPKSTAEVVAAQQVATRTYNSYDWHMKIVGKTGGTKRSGSVFNPFGRFASEPYSVHLHPGVPRDERKAIYELLSKDKKYVPSPAHLRDAAAKDDDEDLEEQLGYPDRFEHDGAEMVQTETTDWGALYRLSTKLMLPPDAAPVRPPRLISELPLKGTSAEFKYGKSLAIDAATLQSWANTRKGSQSQTSVMGVSTAKVAANAGYQVPTRASGSGCT